MFRLKINIYFFSLFFTVGANTGLVRSSVSGLNPNQPFVCEVVKDDPLFANKQRAFEVTPYLDSIAKKQMTIVETEWGDRPIVLNVNCSWSVKDTKLFKCSWTQFYYFEINPGKTWTAYHAQAEPASVFVPGLWYKGAKYPKPKQINCRQQVQL